LKETEQIFQSKRG